MQMVSKNNETDRVALARFRPKRREMLGLEFAGSLIVGPPRLLAEAGRGQFSAPTFKSLFSDSKVSRL